MTATPPPAPGTPVPPPQYPPPSKTWMNITSFVLAFLGWSIPFAFIAGVVFGHMGIKAADRGEADYRGLGLAGLILNYVFLGLSALFVIAYIAFFVFAIAASESSSGPYYLLGL